MIAYRECIGLSMYEILMKIKEEYGCSPAFSWWEGDGPKKVTYEELVRHVLTLADFFEEHNLKGKRIVISGVNAYEHVVSMLAAVTMGAAAAMLNFDLGSEILRRDLKKLEPALMICQKEEIVSLEECGMNEICPLLYSDSDSEKGIRTILRERNQCYQMKEKVDLETPSLLLRTSGSTGDGKWVILPQRTFWPHDTSPTGKQVLVLPLYHVAVISAIQDNICQGVPLCLSDMSNGIRDIGWFKPKLLLAVPLFLKLLIKKAKQGELDLSCFEIVGSGGTQEDQSITHYLSEQGIFSPSLYGATETMGSVAYSSRELYKKGSIGRIGAWNQVRISEKGEVLVKGSCIMTGYLGDPDGTKKVLKDGWYYTGDSGFIDDDGFLFITGRLKNTIILSNGENVNPETIESALSACQLIQEVLVKGENDMLVAYLWCGEKGDYSAQEQARNFVAAYNRSAPLYCRVRKVVFVDAPFERTESGKVKR